MKAFLGCLQSEFLKQRNTIFYPLHLAVPVLFLAVVSGYFTMRGWPAEEAAVLQLMLQMISIGLPLLGSVICGLVCELELSAGSCQHVLALPYRRGVVLGARIVFLGVMCAFSLSLTAGGIYTIFNVVGLAADLPRILFTMGILWFGSMVLYLVNLFLGYQFGIGFCGLNGFLGVIVAALGETMIFDQIWTFLPQSWLIRFTMSYVKGIPLSRANMISVAAVIGVLFFLLFFWYSRWEGKIRSE